MGRPRKEKEKPEEELSPAEIEAQELALPSESLEKRAKERFTPEFFRALTRIAYYTANVGLPLEEACLLADVEKEHFEELRVKEPLVDRIIRVKELQFKKDMLRTIAQDARNGDSKTAQWFLEKKYPQEYGSKRGNADETPGDFMVEAFRFIRKNGDTNSLVVPSASRAAVVIKKDDRPLDQRIDDILGNELPASPNQHHA